MLTSPKMFGLKTYEFWVSTDAWPKKFTSSLLKRRISFEALKKKRRKDRFLLMKSGRKADDLWCMFLGLRFKIRKTSEKCSIFFLYPASSPELDPAVIEQRYALDHSMYPLAVRTLRKHQSFDSCKLRHTWSSCCPQNCPWSSCKAKMRAKRWSDW